MRIPIKVYEDATNLLLTDYIQKAGKLKIKSKITFEEDGDRRWYITYLI